MKMLKYIGGLAAVMLGAYTLYAYTPGEAQRLMQEAKKTSTSIERIREIETGFKHEGRKKAGTTYTRQIAELKGIIEGREAAMRAGTRGGAGTAAAAEAAAADAERLAAEATAKAAEAARLAAEAEAAQAANAERLAEEARAAAEAAERLAKEAEAARIMSRDEVVAALKLPEFDESERRNFNERYPAGQDEVILAAFTAAVNANDYTEIHRLLGSITTAQVELTEEERAAAEAALQGTPPAKPPRTPAPTPAPAPTGVAALFGGDKELEGIYNRSMAEFPDVEARISAAVEAGKIKPSPKETTTHKNAHKKALATLQTNHTFTQLHKRLMQEIAGVLKDRTNVLTLADSATADEWKDRVNVLKGHEYDILHIAVFALNAARGNEKNMVKNALVSIFPNWQVICGSGDQQENVTLSADTVEPYISCFKGVIKIYVKQ